MKTCKECEVEQKFENFTKSKVHKDGYENKCKKCRNASRKSKVKKCEQCEKTFKTAKSDTRYCSSACVGLSRKDRVEVECPNCRETFETTRHRLKNTVYCSRECFAKQMAKTKGKEHRDYKRETIPCAGCLGLIEVLPSQIKNGKRVFCSKSCYKKNIGKFVAGELNHNYKRVVCKCDNCGEAFSKIPSNVKEHNFCSKGCRNTHIAKMSKKLLSDRVKVTCLNCEKELHIKPSVHKSRKYHYCSVECKNSHCSKTYNSGENNHAFNKNLTLEERMLSRSYKEYTDWRIAVYERDGFTCVHCKSNKGGDLNAHHLYNYATHESIRLDINNGVTLCKKCHFDFHSQYGYYNNSEEQFNEFLKSTNKPIMSQACVETPGRCND